MVCRAPNAGGIGTRSVNALRSNCYRAGKIPTRFLVETSGPRRTKIGGMINDRKAIVGILESFIGCENRCTARIERKAIAVLIERCTAQRLPVCSVVLRAKKLPAYFRLALIG